MEGQMEGQMHLTFWVAVCEAILTVVKEVSLAFFSITIYINVKD